MKVLVVHRQTSTLEEVKRELPLWQIKKTQSGLDGLLAARVSKFDFILCGLDLPVVTGIELARSIRNLSYNPKVPIVFLSDGTEQESHERIARTMNINFLRIDQLSNLQELALYPS